jgi:hypothetical protein
MMKRLGKVKEFLSGCSDKQQVARKVEESYQKSIDSHGENAFKVICSLFRDKSNSNSVDQAYSQASFLCNFKKGLRNFHLNLLSQLEKQNSMI